MKFLTTIRFAPSDAQVFAQAAEEGEWAVSGAFAFAALPPEALNGKLRQAFANGFLSLDSFGHSTFTSVTGITDAERARITDRLADHFVARYGAPDRAAARPPAEEEVAYIADLCAGLPIGKVVAVSREIDDAGQLREAFRTIDKPASCAEGGAWQIVEAET